MDSDYDTYLLIIDPETGIPNVVRRDGKPMLDAREEEEVKPGDIVGGTMKEIKARCIETFQRTSGEERLCEVSEGEELVAVLHEESEEYFAKDSKGRKVYVGCLNANGELVLKYFELVGEGVDKQ
jgi:hypothetical protein